MRSPEHSLARRLRLHAAALFLGLLCVLGLVESAAAMVSYRESITLEDWLELDAAIRERDESLPLIVASEWLAPSARMHLRPAPRWDSAAYPDLRYPEFWLLTHRFERPWNGALEAELEGLPRPQLVETLRAGALTLRRYTHETGEQTFSLLDSVTAVRTARGACRGGTQWACKEGRVALATIEVDYRARRCLSLELDDGAVATIDLGQLELGDRLRGHVGFGDFNARLRADPSARIEVLVDGQVAGRWLFTDDQGWAAFALRTPAGSHRVQLRASTSVGGSWQREGHRTQPTDTLCIEMRGFRGGSEGA